MHAELVVLGLVLIGLGVPGLRRRLPVFGATPWWLEVGLWALFVYVCYRDVVSGPSEHATDLTRLLIHDTPPVLGALLAPVGGLRHWLTAAGAVLAVAAAAHVALRLRRPVQRGRRQIVVTAVPGSGRPPEIALAFEDAPPARHRPASAVPAAPAVRARGGEAAERR